MTNGINVITNPHARVRTMINCSEPKLTDESQSKSTNINLIMDQYRRTGMLPMYKPKQALYIDETLIPDAISSFNVVNEARELFLQLPSKVRKAMDNDPRNLEAFIADPENKEFLLKHGVLTKKEEPQQKSIFTPQDLEFLKGLKEEKAQG